MWSTASLAQSMVYKYEPTAAHPFGQLNPEAPPQTADYAPLIGESNCKSIVRNPDGTWSKDTLDMIWRFKYIMNGMALQDETLKADGKHSGSIRQYNADSAKWYVTYFSSSAANPRPPVWSGSRDGDHMILLSPQKSPNGKEGFYRINFENISNEGFNWRGEWISVDSSFVYPTWKIFCKKED